MGPLCSKTPIPSTTTPSVPKTTSNIPTNQSRTNVAEKDGKVTTAVLLNLEMRYLVRQMQIAPISNCF